MKTVSDTAAEVPPPEIGAAIRPHLTEVPRAEEQPTMTIDESAPFLGISRNSAYEAARRGDLPTIRIGRRLLVPTAAFRRLVGLDSDSPSAA